MEEKISVSILCNAFNHGRYIADTLDGFLMQKTDFRFEVLVHDDASTDNTAAVIREYEKKYPDIIKPVYQTENQYSKGVKVSVAYQYPRIRGEFVAVCEGDDYWTDPLKLQKQYDVLNAHPDVDICAHCAERVDAETKALITLDAPKEHDCIIDLEDVILGGGGYVATNSLMYRASLLKTTPEFRKKLQLDYTLQIHGAMRGGMLYLKDNMSAYRVGVPGSWTTLNRQNVEKNILNRQKIIDMLAVFDKETNYKYTEAVKKHSDEQNVSILYLRRNYKGILKYKDYIRALPLKEKIKTYLRAIIR